MEDQQHLAMRQQPFSQKQRWTHLFPHVSRFSAPELCSVRLIFALVLHPCRLKPVQKVEGITNGMSSGSGQQQQQQSSGLSDISTQVQQYQQFLGESQYQHEQTLEM